jgi:hypothetical protein
MHSRAREEGSTIFKVVFRFSKVLRNAQILKGGGVEIFLIINIKEKTQHLIHHKENFLCQQLTDFFCMSLYENKIRKLLKR